MRPGRRRSSTRSALVTLVLASGLALAGVRCNGGSSSGAPPSLPPPTPLPPPPAGLSAGVSSRYIDFPVGVSLGGYGGRTEALIYHPFGGGPEAPEGKNGRPRPHAHIIPPSIGVYTRPRAQALALTWTPEGSGEETVVIAHIDAIFPLLAMRNRVLERVQQHIGVDLTQNLLLTASHSHQSGAPFWNNFLVSVGGMDAFDEEIFERMTQSIARAVEDALAARQPAAIGVATRTGFDPNDEVYLDRRFDNDDKDLVTNGEIERSDDDGELIPDGKPDGKIKDTRLSVFRVDKADGSPLAVLFHFGVHGTASPETNLFMSGDVPEGMEVAVGDALGAPAVVMHIQGAAGDITPHADSFQTIEGDSAKAARDVVALWHQALPRDHIDGVQSITSIQRQDRQVLGYDDPNLPAPYTRWTAPFGQLLCGDGLIPMTGIPDFTDPFVCLTRPAGYHNPLIGKVASELLVPLLFNNVTVDGHSDDFLRDIVLGSNPEGGPYKKPSLIFDTEFSSFRIRGASVVYDGATPAIRDLTIAAVPGEPTTPLSMELRQKIAHHVPDTSFSDTWVFGYAQDYLEYILTKEDWLDNGYEMQLQPWGPLWGEFVMDRSVKLARSLETSDPPPPSDVPAYDDPVPLELTQPTASHAPGVVRQPDSVDRLQTAVLSFIGGDPELDTPDVVLQRENPAGEFEDVQAGGGRKIGESGPETMLVYDYDETHKDTEPHLWSLHWETTADTPTGTYRMHVSGVNYDGSPANAEPPYWNGAPYQFDSSPFVVRESQALVISGVTLDRNTVQLDVTYPPSPIPSDPNTPDHFRFRPDRPGAANASVEIRSDHGTVVTVEGDVSSGGPLSIPSPLAPGHYDVSVLATDEHQNTGQSLISGLIVK